MSAVGEYRNARNSKRWKPYWLAKADAAVAELEAENKTANGIISGLASVVKDAGEDLQQAEAEQDAAWELVEELDPHYLKRKKMGMPRPREGGE